MHKPPDPAAPPAEAREPIPVSDDLAAFFAELDDMGEEPGEAAPAPPLDPPSLAPVRVDKWLWAARCFKSRSAATAACGAGQVQINGQVAKAAAKVKAGDRVELRTPQGPRVFELRGTAERRGSPAVARSLFIDHSPPRAARPSDPWVQVERGAGRPSKRDRRSYDREKSGWGTW
jgi:ribosome-associated heat shock protein Hsp15